MTEQSNSPWSNQDQEGLSHGTLHPLDGWPLPMIADLEAASPGFLLHALLAGQRWRQSLYTFFSLVGLERANGFLFLAMGSEVDGPWHAVMKELGGCLRSMPPKAILAATFSEVPHGLAGSLSKLGISPMPSPTHYQRLVNILLGESPEARERARTLLQLERITSNILDSILIIDPVALNPKLISRIGSGERASRLNETLAALRSLAGATDEALRQSLNERSETFRVHEFLHAWVSKVYTLPPSCEALEVHPDFERVVPATAEGMGRRFRNCLGLKMLDLLAGVWSAWLWKPGNLIVTLTQVETGFLLTGIHAHDNFDAPPEQIAQVRGALAAAGVICLNRVPVAAAVKPLLDRRWDRFAVDELEFA